MDMWTWVILIAAGLIVLELILLLVGMGGVLTWICTAIYHLFKLEEPPGHNDASWSDDQGREVDDK
jgi:fatty acid desaturase